MALGAGFGSEHVGNQTGWTLAQTVQHALSVCTSGLAAAAVWSGLVQGNRLLFGNLCLNVLLVLRWGDMLSLEAT